MDVLSFLILNVGEPMSHSIVGYAQSKSLYSTLPIIQETASEQKALDAVEKMTQEMILFTQKLALHQNTMCVDVLGDDCWSDCLKNAEESLLSILTKIDSSQPVFGSLSQKEIFKTALSRLIIKIAYNIDHKIEILRVSLETRECIPIPRDVRTYDRERVFWQKKESAVLNFSERLIRF